MSYLYISKSEPDYYTLPFNVMRREYNRRANHQAFPIHNHLALEINVMVEGSMKVMIDGAEYRQETGDVLLFNPLQLHEGVWAEEPRRGRFFCLTCDLPGLLLFQKSPLSKEMGRLLDGKSAFENRILAGSTLITDQVTGLFEVYTQKTPANECRSLKMMYEILDELFLHHYIEDLPAPLNAGRKNVEFMRNVTLFIRENYRSPITSADAARALYMEHSLFCHMFKKHFGDTFSNHLCQYRIRCAADIDHSGNMPLSIQDIALSVGFTDYCWFSRSFKKYIGMPPSRYFGVRR